ncbi:hypothetical protein Tco_0866833 [Tanacetum coccineum]
MPYHGDSSDDDLVVNSRANFVYPGENDADPSIEERAILFLEAHDRVKKGHLFKSSTLIVDKIKFLEKQILEGKLVLVDDDGKLLEKGVEYGPKSLLEQWRESNIENDYDPYDDDMHESQEIPDNI